MRHLSVVLGCLAALALAPAAVAQEAPPPPPPPAPPASSQPSQPAQTAGSSTGNAKSGWAKAQIKAVVAAGLMAPSVASFRGDDSLTRGELSELLAALGGNWAVSGDPAAPVKLRELDAALVRLLGQSKTASALRKTLAAAGLRPNGRVGTETVARLLGLRLNHPQERDPLELGPNSAVTRAEAAYSVARVLELRASRSAQAIAGPAAAIDLPELTEWQRRVIARAIRFVGYPYIWGGSSERAQAPFGVRVPGGFDCSGLVWRVYKLEPFDGAPELANTLQGRTTYVMSGEFPVAQRIPFRSIQPGDLLFFGDQGTASKPSQVGHMGIALGGGWMIHSSSRGVTIAPVEGWYADRFAWGRRPLAEAGLE